MENCIISVVLSRDDGGEVQFDLPATAGVTLARAKGAADPAALTDRSGWTIINLHPRPPTKSPRLLEPTNSNKPLVYVNPDRNEADELEVPAGSGFRILNSCFKSSGVR